MGIVKKDERIEVVKYVEVYYSMFLCYDCWNY